MKWFIRLFGLRGSWKWACRQLDKGLEIRPQSATGCVRYRLDLENQRRLEWWFGSWENANFFLSHLERTDWELVGDRVWKRGTGYINATDSGSSLRDSVDPVVDGGAK